MTPNPNPNAFTRASTFSKVVDAFKKATGLSVKDGKLMRLHDGSSIITFNQTNTRPFYATGAGNTIRLNAGFVSYAGRTYYFPADTYTVGSNGGLFIKLDTHYTASAVATEEPWEPWSVMPVESVPQIVIRSTNVLGEYCQLTNLDDPDNMDDDPYAIGVGGQATLYIPLAGFSDGQVVNYVTRNIFILPVGYDQFSAGHGPLNYRDGWG